ncbi:hypothetical protein SLEP1_g35829 [Rubroshorea leprosula]|uniref:Disease resistance protein RGA3 n=1 Tax=Rubroshorea leprosula TaxID=152421 RepID=A0AAV5KPJ3_9ROSI|nr:hypothetical protein SLEP1_g35829 [Rubroshorea leprosula]
MADAILSLLLDQVKTIINMAKKEVKLLVGVTEEVEKLERNLDLVLSVLAHAKEKKATDELVKKWLDRLKEAAYDMEDALDEWKTRAELEVKGTEDAANRQGKVLLLRNFISCFSFRRLSSRREVAVNIKEINRRIDEIVKEKDKYQLESRKIELPKRPETSSFVDVSKLCGRDGVKREILSYLLGGNSEVEAGKLIQTFSIVGMGGLGKTALAQLVYNDPNVKQHFENVAWVCVSDSFDEKRVAKAIIQGLEKLSGPAANGLESDPLEVLLGRISKSIEGKKYLLVLDDVWADGGQRWDSLKVTFNLGAAGSKILVTTRDLNVASMVGSSDSQIIHLKKLGDEECWSILRDIAFRGKDQMKSREDLEEIGRKIAKRCKGLPLVAKVLGSLLQSRSTKGEWLTILDSEIWKLNLAQKEIFAPLLLSYYDLPHSVRRCFLYCVLFPKDYVYWYHHITSHWLAQGFLGSDPNADLESIGLEYFNTLVAHSFFQDFGIRGGYIFCFKMHDVVHDFGKYLAENEFAMEIVQSDHLSINSAKHRHLLVTADKRMTFPTSISGAEKLRTLVTYMGKDALTCDALRNLFNHCRRLRLLDFNWPDGPDHLCNEVPQEVGKLMHLRYINLANSEKLERLPEELCNILNLECLDLKGCRNLKHLPESIGKLLNLRFLVTNGCFALTHYPKGIGKLTSLRTLIGVIAQADRNDGKEFSIADLGSLKHLCRVWMKVVGNSIDMEEARKAGLQNVVELWIHLAGEVEEDDIIEALNLPPGIIFGFSDNYWLNPRGWFYAPDY